MPPILEHILYHGLDKDYILLGINLPMCHSYSTCRMPFPARTRHIDLGRLIDTSDELGVEGVVFRSEEHNNVSILVNTFLAA